MLLGLYLISKVLDLKSIVRIILAVIVLFGLNFGYARADQSCELSLLGRELHSIDLGDSGLKAYYDVPSGFKFGDPNLVAYLGGFGGISFKNSNALVTYSHKKSYQLARILIQGAGQNLLHMIQNKVDYDPDEIMLIENQVDHVRMVIENLTDKPVAIAGLSAGAIYASETVLANPQKFAFHLDIAGAIRDADYLMGIDPISLQAYKNFVAVNKAWRSILPWAQIPDIDEMNRQNKLREDFGPLIPDVLKQNEAEYFELIFAQERALRGIDRRTRFKSFEVPSAFLLAKGDNKVPNMSSEEAFMNIPEPLRLDNLGKNRLRFISNSRHNLVAAEPEVVADWIETTLTQYGYLK